MKLLKIFGVLLALLIILIIASMVKYGYFTKIVVNDETIPAMNIIAVPHTGPYQNVGPAMGKLYAATQEAKLEGKVGIGIYYDNPQDVPADSLRALVGQILAEEDSLKLDSVKTEFTRVSIPEMSAKVVHFPYKGQLSIIFAVMRVYPALAKMSDLSISTATIEMYDIQGKEIRFIIPQNLSRDDMEMWLSPSVTEPSTPTENESETPAFSEDSLNTK
jgi:hypothetical protein